MVNAPDCGMREHAYSLQPSFFAAEPVEEQMEITIQRHSAFPPLQRWYYNLGARYRRGSPQFVRHANRSLGHAQVAGSDGTLSQRDLRTQCFQATRCDEGDQRAHCVFEYLRTQSRQA